MKTIPKGPFLSWCKKVQFCFCFKVRFFSVFNRIKMAKTYLFSRDSYSCSKFVFHWPPLNPENTSFIVLMGSSLVVKIFTNSRFAKIFNSVICWVAIDVVNKVFRPVPINVKPSEPMGLVPRVPDSYVATTFASACSSSIPSFSSATGNAPNKFSCIRVVLKQLAKAGGSQFFFYNTASHDDSFKVGLVRACVAVQTPHRLVQFTGVAV